jgi:hypothetical protein
LVKKDLLSHLPLHAAARAHRADQANYALLVHAKDDMALAIYQHYGFVPYVSNPLILFLPLATATRLLDNPS